MPSLSWIGKDKVINHHQDVPFRVLERSYTYDESNTGKEGWGTAPLPMFKPQSPTERGELDECSDTLQG